MRDPLALLRLDRADRVVADLVLTEAARMQEERDAALLKAQARLIRNEIAQMLK